MRTASGFLIAVLFALGVSCGPKTDTTEQEGPGKYPPLKSYMLDSSATVDSLELVFYIPVNAYPALTTTRPLRSDSSVVFVCAAAFTLLENDAIDGLFIDGGKIEVKWVNHSLGGGIVLPEKTSNARPNIFGTDMGEKLDSTFKDSICSMQASFFQQIQLVRAGKALRFQREFSRFQRRALCMYHGELVVVESVSGCTMQKFADVLESCGIPNALYVDMGSWDEGWYRKVQHQQPTIGLLRSETDRQSNWFVFRGK